MVVQKVFYQLRGTCLQEQQLLLEEEGTYLRGGGEGETPASPLQYPYHAMESELPAPHKVSSLSNSINPAMYNAQYFASLKSYLNFRETLPKH